MRITSPNSGDNYRPGDPHAICDECGLQYRHSELKRRWDGAMVCRKDWEPRHPQEMVRGRAERVGVPNARPETYAAVVNDDCLAATDWTLGIGWTLGSGFGHSTGTEVLDRALTGLVSGASYSLQVRTSGRSAGSVVVSLVTATGDTTITADQQYSVPFTAAAATDTVRFTPTTDFDGAVEWLAVYPKASTVTQADL